jgi:hypothetical protein
LFSRSSLSMREERFIHKLGVHLVNLYETDLILGSIIISIVNTLIMCSCNIYARIFAPRFIQTAIYIMNCGGPI